MLSGMGARCNQCPEPLPAARFGNSMLVCLRCVNGVINGADQTELSGKPDGRRMARGREWLVHAVPLANRSDLASNVSGFIHVLALATASTAVLIRLECLLYHA